MPFASLNLPSLGLTQLKAVMESRFKDQVSIEICYVNQDFGRLFGVELYTWMALSGEAHNTGIGDWFFRQEAFPELEDNSEAYFRRFFPSLNQNKRVMKRFIVEKRKELDQILDSIIARYGLDQVHLAGFTSMFSQNVASFAMARRLKQVNPGVITAIGGANCEAPMGKVFADNVPSIDYVFSGPALISLPQFFQLYLDDELEKSFSINGVFTRRNGEARRASLPTLGACQTTKEMGDELDINQVIDLDYGHFLDTLEANFPEREVEPTITFETSRGCWWGERAHCTFCGLNGQTMAYRAMDAEKAIGLIRSMLAYYPRSRRFNCVDNIMPKEYVKGVFPYLETPPGISIFYEVKADLSEDDLQTLSKGGVRVVQPGVESLATSTLKLMKKGTSVFQNIALLKNCVMNDINPTWNLLVGFPGEGDEIYKRYVRLLPMLSHLPAPDGVFPVRFDRFSPYFMKAREYQLELEPVDYYEMIYPFDKQGLASMAYYFTDRNLNAKYFLTMAKWIDKVRQKFSIWKSRWFCEDGKLVPKLYFKKEGNASTIYDSRSGEALEYFVSEADRELLECLNKPKRIHELSAELAHIPHFEPEQRIAFLQERELIFDENERYMSLVLPKEPPEMTFKNT
jgi:ribosomal peptide maturation radical SAM protein 1